jgi:hypothetical protein
LVCGSGRKKINHLKAAFAAAFESSQNRCVVAANVMRHCAAAVVYFAGEAKFKKTDEKQFAVRAE